ncbi:MAG: hypothetical protein RBS77_05805 [Candidatus Moranbacteria bacterium]|nr:hypothetical protein [Candidatus Moranbacteria bacterium]
MKKIIFIAGISIAVLLIGGATYWKIGGGFKKEEVKKEKYKINIEEPIRGVVSNEKDATLGDLEKDKVTVTINKGSFDGEREISIVTPRDVPNAEKDSQLVDSPIEISAGENPVRLNEKTEVTFKFDVNNLPKDTQAHQLQVAYYNGERWDYIKPLRVDMEKGVMTFETYHFSWYAPKVSDETKITEKWIHSQALDNVIRGGVNDTSSQVTDQIIGMTLGKMGITNEETQKQIMEKVAGAEKYKEIVELYKSGDTVGASQKIAILAGEKIAETVPDSVWKGALEKVTGGADDIAKVSQAAGYAAEGQYKDAARIIGEEIADKFLITTAGKIAVEAINGQIDSWKNEEVDAAYIAYKNGANGKFWGYSLDKGDFNAVWDQMRGVRRQLEIEAIRKENDARKEAGMPELSEKEMNMLRDRVKVSYQRQFAERDKKEEAIKKEEDKMKQIFAAFKKANLFDDTLGPNGLDKGLGYEGKMEVLNHFAKKIMVDTNRPDVSDKEGLVMETKISVTDIAMGARIYFSLPDGKKKYEEYIKERFGVGLYPALKDLTGTWNGSITITDIIVSDEYKAKDQAGEGEEGCDLVKLEELKGKANPLKFELKPNGENGGMFVPVGDSDAKPMPFTYNNGEIEIPLYEEGATGKMTFKAEKTENGGFKMNGGMSIDYAGGQIKIKGETSAQK